MSRVPIADHALLSDRHSAALVTTWGSVDWLCFPRFDSTSVFAAILDDDAGHWSIRPTGEFTTERSYVEDTMALGEPSDPHHLGENAPHTLLRALHCTRGRVTLEMTVAPRPEYGLVVPVLTQVDGGTLAMGGPDQFTLTSPVPLHCSDGTGRARIDLDSGQRRYLALSRSPLGEPATRPSTQKALSAALEATIQQWREWSRLHQKYHGRGRSWSVARARSCRP